MYKIKYLAWARIDLELIFNFISFWSEKNAVNIILDIQKTILNLSFFPLLGKDIWFNRRVLINSKYKYKIFYEIHNNSIYIVNIEKNKK